MQDFTPDDLGHATRQTRVDYCPRCQTQIWAGCGTCPSCGVKSSPKTRDSFPLRRIPDLLCGLGPRQEIVERHAIPAGPFACDRQDALGSISDPGGGVFTERIAKDGVDVAGVGDGGKVIEKGSLLFGKADIANEIPDPAGLVGTVDGMDLDVLWIEVGSARMGVSGLIHGIVDDPAGDAVEEPASAWVRIRECVPYRSLQSWGLCSRRVSLVAVSLPQLDQDVSRFASFNLYQVVLPGKES